MSASTWGVILLVCAGALMLLHALFGPDAKYRRSLRRTQRAWQSHVREARPAPARHESPIELSPLRQRLEYLNRPPVGEHILPHTDDPSIHPRTPRSQPRPDHPAQHTPKRGNRKGR
jgi:hypothetical protein